MIEIEIKAALTISAYHRVCAELQTLCHTRTPIKKSDAYYVHHALGSEKMIRIRTSAGNHICTVKSRSVENGIEHNREHEFHVDDADQFIAALQLLAFKLAVKKQKIGFVYSYDMLTVEVIQVIDLGYFIEIERLVAEQDYTHALKQAIQQQFLTLLDRLHIPKKNIVSERYIDLLQANKQ